MNIMRYLYASDWAQGTLSNVYIDTATYISRYNHPSIVPSGQTLIGGSTYTGSQAYGLMGAQTGNPNNFNSANTQGHSPTAFHGIDQFAYTYQAGDALTFTTTSHQVTIMLNGILASGMNVSSGNGLTSNFFRNGVIVNILVDNVLQSTVDTYQATPSVSLYLDGLLHTISVVHSGSYNNAIAPLSSPVATVGTSVYRTQRLASQYHPTLTAAQWQIVATSSTAYNVNLWNGASYVLATGGGNLSVGTHYSSVIPGIDVYIAPTDINNNAVSLVVGDAITFTTDVTTMSIYSIAVGSSTQQSGGAGAYSSQIIDAQDPMTSWFLTEWTQSVAMATVSISTGNSPIPDASWQTYVTAPNTSNLSGTGSDTVAAVPYQMGFGGIMNSARGRYAQFTITFPSVTTNVQAWIRDLTLYYWTPEVDSSFVGKLAIGARATVGPLMAAFTGALSATLAATQGKTYDLASSTSITTAVDQYLQGYGHDLTLVQYPAEPPNSYQARISAAFRSRSQGGSIAFMTSQLNQLVLGNNNPPSGGCSIVTKSGSPANQFQVTIPSAGGGSYPGLPGLSTLLAKTIIQNFVINILTPVGSVITPNIPLGNPSPSTINIIFN